MHIKQTHTKSHDETENWNVLMTNSLCVLNNKPNSLSQLICADWFILFSTYTNTIIYKHSFVCVRCILSPVEIAIIRIDLDERNSCLFGCLVRVKLEIQLVLFIYLFFRVFFGSFYLFCLERTGRDGGAEQNIAFLRPSDASTISTAQFYWVYMRIKWSGTMNELREKTMHSLLVEW